MQRVSWPVQYRLEHLTICACGSIDPSSILHQLPYLQKLLTKDCNMHSIYDKAVIFCVSTPSSSLTTLIISQHSLSMNYLESLLSLTPSFRHLKIVSNLYRLDSVVDSSYWQQCIQTKRPSLVKFEFLFLCAVGRNSHYTSLESLIGPFQTPFWLEDKRWFVTCSYVIKSGVIWLNTTPF